MNDIFPEVAFRLLGIPVRTTVVNTWIVMAVLTGLAAWVGRRMPTGLEMLVDFLDDLLTELLGRPAEPYLPLLGSLAIFVASANIIGVVPYLEPPTGDVNTPIALAIVVFFSVHYYGILELGLLPYLRSLASPIFLLPLEIISQVSRTISLAIRLFGNILSAEIIVAVLFALAPLFVPLPLQGFSIFTGLLQAYIFTALAAVYIAAGLEQPVDTQQRNADSPTS